MSIMISPIEQEIRLKSEKKYLKQKIKRFEEKINEINEELRRLR